MSWRTNTKNEIHANEIVLLAYYIAAINIEAVYHSLSGGDYAPFDGICLTDTFQLYEQDKDLLATLMPDNSNRRMAQKARDIRVIVGNPPYSVGQGSANDNAANVAYPKLDARIRETYAARSDATNKNALYDSYIRAIRWASDRLGRQDEPDDKRRGIVAFVSNAGWIDGNTTDGLRQCLVEEFASIHVFHLRGNQRTSGDRSRREGGKIFGSGSRTPVAITLLVKNPDAAHQGEVLFHDIGDYLSQEEKLKIIARFGSLDGISEKGGWQSITPDEHGDWLGQRDNSFDGFIAIGDKDDKSKASIFANYSRGIATARDTWCYNGSRVALASNMGAMIKFYNQEVERFEQVYALANRKARESNVDDFVNNDTTKISWNRGLKADIVKGKVFEFNQDCIRPSLYRPFTMQWLYYHRNFNDMVYQMPRIYPMAGYVENRVIHVSGVGSNACSLTMSNTPPCLDNVEKGQCFPRFLYDETAQTSDDVQADYLADTNATGLKRRDALTDDGLAHFQAAYPGETITKDDLFYYVYGLLHSEEYRARFADNLSKQLPRIPAVKKAKDFWAFVAAGRRLGDLHCDFEAQVPFAVTIAQGALELAHIPDPESFYRVEKMKFGGKRPHQDKSTVIYNSNITMTDIPLEAYDYVVNGKPALEWVMERQCVKTDKASGIVNDANRYSIETMGDPAYPLLLFRRVITVSLETMKIVNALPKLEID